MYAARAITHSIIVEGNRISFEIQTVKHRMLLMEEE